MLISTGWRARAVLAVGTMTAAVIVAGCTTAQPGPAATTEASTVQSSSAEAPTPTATPATTESTVDASTTSTASPAPASTSTSAAAVTTTAPTPSTSAPATTTSTRPTPPATTLPVATTAEMVDDPGSANAALTTLSTLKVKGRAPMTGYSRDQFGPAWTDDTNAPGGHNGCDTRNDILRRDLTTITIKPGSNGCTVLTGVLHDPYTGKTIDFTRGESTSTAVQIDHMVALGDAWQTGAQQISEPKREELANDPLNLQSTDGPDQRAEGRR